MARGDCPSCHRPFKHLGEHLKYRVEHPDADHPSDGQLPLAALAQAEPATLDVDALVAKLAPAIAKAISTPAAMATPAADSIPSLDAVISHCEGGTCEAHMKQLDALKTRIVTAAFEAMPAEVVKAKAADLGMVDKPRDIRIVAQAGALP